MLNIITIYGKILTIKDNISGGVCQKYILIDFFYWGE